MRTPSPHLHQYQFQQNPVLKGNNPRDDNQQTKDEDAQGYSCPGYLLNRPLHNYDIFLFQTP